jgi:hypothetical protein
VPVPVPVPVPEPEPEPVQEPEPVPVQEPGQVRRRALAPEPAQVTPPRGRAPGRRELAAAQPPAAVPAAPGA